ncbi:MAG: asparaginase [Bradymonadaceae bacterium]
MNKPKVLLLHTGGTLGMKGSPLEPDVFAMALDKSVPEISEIAEVTTQIMCSLDSSDVGPAHWSRLAETIAEKREEYQGFVIVHGTDTMAYTASALSFALRGLDRPVVLTGAQRPLAFHRSDARRNLIDAVEVATRPIPEVGICFDGLLLRGCRTTKSNAHDYRGFESLGCEPLARLGVDVAIGDHVRRPQEPFRCDPRFDDGVFVFTVTPGLRPSILETLVQSEEVRGVVLVAFGTGTVPGGGEPPLADVVARLVDRGVDVLVVTESFGEVNLGLYQNSRRLGEVGAISGGRMGMEAGLTKLMHALAIYNDREERHRFLIADVAGELAQLS